jgi:glutamate-1-semialdehyde 2,1-aminomutase
VFDAHAHLYRKEHFRNGAPALVAGGPSFAGLDIYRRRLSEILPGRVVAGGLFFGYPFADADTEGANRLVAEETRADPQTFASMLVRPEMDPEYVRETVRRSHFAGLKCYHVYAPEARTFDAPVPSYLPEDLVRVAHEERLAITLHMVRPRALADSCNQETIRRYALRYPDARWILAHAARGFNPYHTVEGISALAGLGNVWFDTSAVTEAGAMEAIARTMGVERLLYGSDFPVTHLRGRCVAVGDSFLWLEPENCGQARPLLVGIESLRALRLACLNLRLSDTQIESIFDGNARRLLGARV